MLSASEDSVSCGACSARCCSKFNSCTGPATWGPGGCLGFSLTTDLALWTCSETSCLAASAYPLWHCASNIVAIVSVCLATVWSKRANFLSISLMRSTTDFKSTSSRLYRGRLSSFAATKMGWSQASRSIFTRVLIMSSACATWAPLPSVLRCRTAVPATLAHSFDRTLLAAIISYTRQHGCCRWFIYVTNCRPRYQTEAGDLSDRPETTFDLAPHYCVTLVSPIAIPYSNG